MSVCSRIGIHPQFPNCLTTFPDPDRDSWWVIDEWIANETLASQIGAYSDRNALFSLGRQLAEGLQAAHEVDVILREMSASNILIADADQRPVFADFELAKLVDEYPTVSPEDWPENPYRAPEIGAGDPFPNADIYSWGRIMVEATLGELPPAGQEGIALKFFEDSPLWIELLCQCTKLVSSERPQSANQLLDHLRRVL